MLQPTCSCARQRELEQANSIGAGYSFAGWQAEYYRYYDPATNTLSDLLETSSGYEQPGESITLYTYVEMTAMWQPNEEITVSKIWDDNENVVGLRPENITVNNSLIQNPGT